MIFDAELLARGWLAVAVACPCRCHTNWRIANRCTADITQDTTLGGKA